MRKLTPMILTWMFVSLTISMVLGAPGTSSSTSEKVSKAQTEKSPQLRKSVPAEERGLPAQALMVDEVRHQLVMIASYDVFDWLEGEATGDGNVTLHGQVVKPIISSDAVVRVRKIDGVKSVANEIETLPPSPSDDQLRVAVFRAIYNFNSPLFNYAIRSVPPIHIIIKNGRATPKGVVADVMDSQLAYTAASSVPGLFEVTNELRVESK